MVTKKTNLHEYKDYPHLKKKNTADSFPVKGWLFFDAGLCFFVFFPTEEWKKALVGGHAFSFAKQNTKMINLGKTKDM